MRIQPYKRRAQFYETDQMGIIHHANYIRWFEEARVDMMEQTGYGYKQLEAEGLGSPVLGVSCEYKQPVLFSDDVLVYTYIKELTQVRITIGYEIRNAEGKLCTVGETRHCFAKASGRPVSLKKAKPELYALYEALLQEQAAERADAGKA